MTETESEYSSLPCFKCGNDIELEPFTKGLREAMTFTSHGGYGSVIYDPINTRVFLRIHLCDICVAAGAIDGRVLEGTRTPVPDKITHAKWMPGGLEQ